MSDNISKIEKWFLIPKPNPTSRIRLFCFPYAGGGSSVFYSWPEYLNEETEIIAIRMPGHESRINEKPLRHVQEIVLDLIQILPLFLDRPFAFFGHSLGARICFELVRKLRHEQLPEPKHFFASGSRAPHLPPDNPDLHNLPDKDFIEGIKKYDGLPEIILENPEIIDFFIPLMRADIEVFNTYEYKEDTPLSCPISAFGGNRDPRVSREAISAWEQHTQNRFKIHMLPGGHFFINNSKRELLQYIDMDLQKYL